MGRTYSFECTKCGYVAKVTGGFAEGREFAVQTIACSDCRELQDAVTSVVIPVTGSVVEDVPPPLAQLMTRLPLLGREDTKRQRFPPACTRSASHATRVWNQPDKCPRCGVFMERDAFPLVQWD
jgi:hypothetical protein